MALELLRGSSLRIDAIMVFTMVIVVITVNLIADLLCAAVDPTMKDR